MWILDKNQNWKNVTDEQFLAMSQKANGIKPKEDAPIVDVIEQEKPKARKTRAKKAKA